MSFIEKFIPKIIEKTIFDVDFQRLFDLGKRYILIDLDNTLIPYDMTYADADLKKFINKIKNLGFTIIVTSNNHTNRVMTFANDLNLRWVANTKKPLKMGFKRALKMLGKPNINEVVAIGDQLMTDVYGASRMKMESVLVHPIKKKSEKWYTKINRFFERKIIHKIERKYNDVYKELEAKHEY